MRRLLRGMLPRASRPWTRRVGYLPLSLLVPFVWFFIYYILLWKNNFCFFFLWCRIYIRTYLSMSKHVSQNMYGWWPNNPPTMSETLPEHVQTWSKHGLNLVQTRSTLALNLVWTWSEHSPNRVNTWSRLGPNMAYTCSKLGLNFV